MLVTHENKRDEIEQAPVGRRDGPGLNSFIAAYASIPIKVWTLRYLRRTNDLNHH